MYKNKKQYSTMKIANAMFFIIVGYGLSQIIRLGSNIVLTRLLVPEFFGIVSLAQVVFTGINLFSDIGISVGLIRSPRSHDSDYVNTAWTIKVIRGFILFILAVILAYPVALFYDEITLFYIIPVMGLNAIFQGFYSTSLDLLKRDFKQGIQVSIELFSQIISTALLILMAYWLRNIWALAIGRLFSCMITLIISHSLKGYEKNKFCLESDAVKDLLHFGKWILISTAFTFLATQADKIIFGKIFTLTFLGVYNIATVLSEIPKQVMSKISHNVLYPLFSNYNNFEHGDFRSKIYCLRNYLLYPIALFVALFAGFGDIIINVLYDPRYSEAAWMLPLLALGIWPLVLHSTIGSALFALGKPKYSTYGHMAKLAYMLTVLPLFFFMWGKIGAIVAVVFNDIPVYCAINIGLKKEKLNFFKQDFFATISLLFFIFIIYFIRMKINTDIPIVTVFQ